MSTLNGDVVALAVDGAFSHEKTGVKFAAFGKPGPAQRVSGSSVKLGLPVDAAVAANVFLIRMYIL